MDKLVTPMVRKDTCDGCGETKEYKVDELSPDHGEGTGYVEATMVFSPMATGAVVLHVQDTLTRKRVFTFCKGIAECLNKAAGNKLTEMQAEATKAEGA